MGGFVVHLDESQRWKLISVGAFMCALEDLPEIRLHWARLRRRLGLRQNEELKWNWPKDDVTRKRVEEAGWTKKKRNEAVVATIANMPLTLMADLLLDERTNGRGPRDFHH